MPFPAEKDFHEELDPRGQELANVWSNVLKVAADFLVNIDKKAGDALDNKQQAERENKGENP